MAENDTRTSVRPDDYPEVGEWVRPAEAAALANVSRQYIWQVLDEFDPHQLSGIIVLRRDLVLAWKKKRAKAAKARARKEKLAEPDDHAEKMVQGALAELVG